MDKSVAVRIPSNQTCILERVVLLSGTNLKLITENHSVVYSYPGSDHGRGTAYFKHIVRSSLYCCLSLLIVFVFSVRTASASYPAPGLWTSANATTRVPGAEDWGTVADSTCRYFHPVPTNGGWTYFEYRATSAIPNPPAEGATILLECHLNGDAHHLGQPWATTAGFLVYRTNQCYANATNTNGICNCNAGFVTGTTQTSCVPVVPAVDCPITGITIDPADPNGLEALIKQYDKTEEERLLTKKLEGGLNAYNLLTDKTRVAEHCLAGRVASELLQADSSYTVTGTVRTLAYQAHLRAMWDKFWELKNKIEKKPSIRQLCPALIAQVEGEMGFRIAQNPKKDDCAPGNHHCIVSSPANPDKEPKHAEYVAFDISKATIKKFANVLLPPRTMATEANACNLTWGGTFKDYDPVHFLCCVK